MDNKQFDKQAIRLHHISSHFTNGLFPVSLLFLLLAVFYDASFESVSYHVLFVAFLASPFAYLSGVVDWTIRFKNARTPIFNHKVYWGIALLFLSGVAVLWRTLAGGDVIMEDALMRFTYLLLNIIITGIVLYLGYLGGKFLLR